MRDIPPYYTFYKRPDGIHMVNAKTARARAKAFWQVFGFLFFLGLLIFWKVVLS